MCVRVLVRQQSETNVCSHRVLFPPSKILLSLASASVTRQTLGAYVFLLCYYSVNYNLYYPLTSHVCTFLFRCKRLMSTTKLMLHAPLFYSLNHCVHDAHHECSAQENRVRRVAREQ